METNKYVDLRLHNSVSENDKQIALSYLNNYKLKNNLHQQIALINLGFESNNNLTSLKNNLNFVTNILRDYKKTNVFIDIVENCCILYNKNEIPEHLKNEVLSLANVAGLFDRKVKPFTKLIFTILNEKKAPLKRDENGKYYDKGHFKIYIDHLNPRIPNGEHLVKDILRVRPVDKFDLNQGYHYIVVTENNAYSAFCDSDDGMLYTDILKCMRVKNNLKVIFKDGKSFIPFIELFERKI